MSQSVHAQTESGLTGTEPVYRDRTHLVTTAAIVAMFAIAVVAIASFDLDFVGLFALASAITTVLASGYLVARESNTTAASEAIWPGVAVCTFGAAAAVLSTIAETDAELTIVAALLLGLAWSFWITKLTRNELRVQRHGVVMLAGSFAIATIALAAYEWTDSLASDANALIVVLMSILALVVVLAKRIESQIASLAGIGIGAAILAGWLELDDWPAALLALLFAAAVVWPQPGGSARQSIARFDPWIGAVGALALFVGGLFSLEDPVRSFAFGAALALFAGSLFASMLQTRERESHVNELLDLNASIQDLARLDYLTGLPNREALELRLLEEVERSVRYRQPLSIAFVDIDHFKSVNDTLGHQAGDTLLRQIADVIRTTIRTPDFVARYGGEEFVVIAPGTWTEDAIILGTRIQNAIARDVNQVLGRPVTVSIGLAGIPEHGTTSEEIIVLADQALYVAKANGRDRIEIASATDESSAP